MGASAPLFSVLSMPMPLDVIAEEEAATGVADPGGFGLAARILPQAAATNLNEGAQRRPLVGNQPRYLDGVEHNDDDGIKRTLASRGV